MVHIISPKFRVPVNKLQKLQPIKVDESYLKQTSINKSSKLRDMLDKNTIINSKNPVGNLPTNCGM